MKVFKMCATWKNKKIIELLYAHLLARNKIDSFLNQMIIQRWKVDYIQPLNVTCFWLQKNFIGKKLKNEDDPKWALVKFFAYKDETFFKNGIYNKLPLRWQEIINSGKCIINKVNWKEHVFELRKIFEKQRIQKWWRCQTLKHDEAFFNNGIYNKLSSCWHKSLKMVINN